MVSGLSNLPGRWDGAGCSDLSPPVHTGRLDHVKHCIGSWDDDVEFRSRPSISAQPHRLPSAAVCTMAHTWMGNGAPWHRCVPCLAPCQLESGSTLAVPRAHTVSQGAGPRTPRCHVTECTGTTGRPWPATSIPAGSRPRRRGGGGQAARLVIPCTTTGATEAQAPAPATPASCTPPLLHHAALYNAL